MCFDMPRPCKEIHYELRKRHYFAIAFENKTGGYEVRNPYYKGCIKGKDISVIRYNKDIIQNHVCVFEGRSEEHTSELQSPS